MLVFRQGLEDARRHAEQPLVHAVAGAVHRRANEALCGTYHSLQRLPREQWQALAGFEAIGAKNVQLEALRQLLALFLECLARLLSRKPRLLFQRPFYQGFSRLSVPRFHRGVANAQKTVDAA